MPHSLRVKLKGLNYKKILTDRELERLCKALDNEDVLEQKGIIITKTCNTCEHYPNDKHCIGCEWDKDKKENTKWELKKNPIAIERKVLDKIRDEIIQMNSLDYVEPISCEEVLEIIDHYMKGE